MHAKLFVYIERLRYNLALLSDLSGGIGVIAVVKANAYGLGAVRVAKAIEYQEKLSMFAVASIEEAIELRDAGIKKEIIILLPVIPACFQEALKYKLTLTVHSKENLDDINRFAEKIGHSVNVHLKIDTGMNRWGVKWSEFDDFLHLITKSDLVNIKGVYSHIFEKGSANIQIKRFDNIIEKLKNLNINPDFIHIASSGSATLKVRSKYANNTRSGLILYGIDPYNELGAFELPFKLTSYILMIKQVKCGETVGYNGAWSAHTDIKLAIIPVGYANGIKRSMSNRGYVIINGKSANIAGMVSMDAIAVNVSGIKAKLYDKVTIIGTDGDKSIMPWEIAKIAGTIPYEIMTGIGNRVERIYI